jgi:hypothetical protein
MLVIDLAGRSHVMAMLQAVHDPSAPIRRPRNGIHESVNGIEISSEEPRTQLLVRESVMEGMAGNPDKFVLDCQHADGRKSEHSIGSPCQAREFGWDTCIWKGVEEGGITQDFVRILRYVEPRNLAPQRSRMAQECLLTFDPRRYRTSPRRMHKPGRATANIGHVSTQRPFAIGTPCPCWVDLATTPSARSDRHHVTPLNEESRILNPSETRRPVPDSLSRLPDCA